MAQDARILDKHLAAIVGMQITAANTHAQRPHQGVAGRRSGGFGYVYKRDRAQSGELKRLHPG